MQLTEITHLECCGRVKYSGIDVGNIPWKNGVLILEKVNGAWKMSLEYDINRGVTHKSYVLYPGVIKKLICKAQLVIELEPLGKSLVNFHFKPHSPKDEGDMRTFCEKMQEIQTITEVEQVRMKTEVKVTPCKQLNQSINSNSQVSPETFTSVKSRKRLCVSDESSDEEGKENRTKTASERFLERAEEKSKNWSSSLSTPVKFYGQTSLQNTYSTYSAKRTPGFLSDPTPNKRMKLINYSWLSKPKLTPPTDSTQIQPTLQGFSNLGNTCYMNAILQSLVNLDTFTTDLLHGNKKIVRTLEPTSLYKCMVQVFYTRLRVVSDFSKREYLKNLKHAISSSAKRFSGFQQHDAHEFLGQLLDQLKEEVTKISKSTPSPHREDEDTENTGTRECINPTVQNFEFEVLHRIRCENCGEEVTKEEQFNDLSVDIPRSRDPTNQRSLQDALEMSLKQEHIEYTCEKCSNNKSVVTHKFTKLPRVLILHLKRYSYNMMMSKHSKAGQNITIPRYLTLQSHCEEETRPPFPSGTPPEPKSISVPDSPLREKNENTPRRRLDTSQPFRFKPSRALTNFDDPDKASTVQTSTPYKKPKDEPDLITDRRITIDDDIDDPELARALELSLKEANDRAQGLHDEVDGMTEENNMKQALEMSKNKTDSKSDHGYERNVGTMTEEEQIELAMRQSMIEFEMMQNSYSTENAEDIRRECGSAVAKDLFSDQTIESNGLSENLVTSKYFQTQPGSELDKMESESRMNGEKAENKISPFKHCDNGSTYELTENSYFKSQNSEIDLSTNNNKLLESKNEIFSDENMETSDSCTVKNVAMETNYSSEEVMTISDDSVEENESCPNSRPQNGSNSKDLLDLADQDATNLKSKETIDLTKKPKLSKDIENIMLLDEMTAEDITPIRTIKRENLDSSMSSVKENGSNKQPDIVDLFCNEDDDFLIDQWDKENFNPGQEDEVVPKIDNEKGELPYSYRLVSIVNHIGSSSVVGHYVSDVYDIKKASWFSCDDSHVSKTTETDVRSKRERTGYIFFYLHKDIYDDLKDHYILHSNTKKKTS